MNILIGHHWHGPVTEAELTRAPEDALIDYQQFS